MDILISNLLSESIFYFGKGSNWKYANTRICVFSVWPLSEVKNWFQKQIWNENIHNYVLNFFEEVLVNILKSQKRIFHRIFKKWFDLGMILFMTKKYSLKAKHPRICPSLGGSMPEAQIKQCPLRPSPKIVVFLQSFSQCWWKRPILEESLIKKTLLKQWIRLNFSPE